jgi:Transposase
MILLFLFSMKGILIVKYKLELVWERVLLEGLARKWRRTKKTILEAAHPSSLHMTNRVLCTKSLLESLIMLFKLPNSSIPSFLILSPLRRTLKEAGLHSATKKKVPMLKVTHRQQRLKFARDHENWTVEDWKRVLWSDETKINRIGSDGKVYV